MPKLFAGVVGAGSIGNVHLEGYAKAADRVAIQAICEINPARLAEMGKKFRVPASHRYVNFVEMLMNEKLDLISVCVPNYLHFPYAAASIATGINTLIEKPMVLTNEQARELKRIAARKKVKTMVAFSHRFFQMNMQAKAIIERGEIGKPFMIRVRYAHRGPYPGWAQGDWFYSKRQAGGGALLDMGIHAIDICQYLVGPIKSVSAEVHTLRKKIQVDDNAVLLLDFGAKKCLGYIECGWTSGPGFAGIEVYGDKGSLILDLVNGPRHIRGQMCPDGTIKTVIEPLKLPEGGQDHWALQMETWVNYVCGKKTTTSIPGLAEGASSLAVALAATESSRTGKRVKLR
jgi:UDP-N-acetylglucosamine 3-dehydrogenase